VGQAVHRENRGKRIIFGFLETKLTLAESASKQGFWSDLDNYYTSPHRLISIEHLSATEAQLTQLFKVVLASA